jgi:hypothetical protein
MMIFLKIGIGYKKSREQVLTISIDQAGAKWGREKLE